MASKDKNIGNLLRKYGYAFPNTEEEIEAYEEKSKDSYSKPSKWPDLSDIIGSKNISNSDVIRLKDIENKSSSNLAMAAREGKEISEEDRKKMNEDKKNARKK
jgi:hypothetical protein